MGAWSLCLALGLLTLPGALAAAPATAAQAAKPQPPDKSQAPAGPQPVATPPANVEPEYKIGAGDVLHIFVWKEADLTHNVNVRIDGRITVPLLGDIVAVGKTSAELGREIGTALGRFVENPLVTVIVTQATSARFFILGEVKSPGPHALAGSMTVVQALAEAGGFGQFAKKDEILVIRGRQSFKVNYDRLEDGSDLAHNLLLQPGDTVIVP
jgi:polysaccharide export outer membrane protein